MVLPFSIIRLFRISRVWEHCNEPWVEPVRVARTTVSTNSKITLSSFKKKRLSRETRLCYQDRCGAVFANVRDASINQRNSANVKKQFWISRQLLLVLTVGPLLIAW